MTPDPRLEAWLATATRKLAPDSIAQVSAEIEQHREGDHVDVAALGDPERANREYRKVLLTEYEARVARRIMQPEPRSRAQEAKSHAIVMAVMLVLQLIARQPGVWPWIWLVVVGLDGVVGLLLPENVAKQYRWHWAPKAARMAFFAVYYWETWAWTGLGFVIALIVLAYFAYQTRTIRRKVNGGPVPAAPPLMPVPASLTKWEAKVLRDMTPGMVIVHRVMMLPLIALTGTLTYFLPLIFGAVTVAMLLCLILPFVVDISTPSRSRQFRRMKMTMAVVAVILPLFQFFLVPFGLPMSAGLGATLILGGVGLNAYLVATFYFMIDRPRASLRRKLPVEEWPKELYL